MEKLLELYRAYLTDEIKKEMYVNWADKECIDMFEADEVEEEWLYKFLNQLSVLKKFVKWLVENDKIDFYTILKENWTFRKEFYAIENKKEYERLIMLLSVEDEPINFLVSMLK